jgi:hypothetical protein
MPLRRCHGLGPKYRMISFLISFTVSVLVSTIWLLIHNKRLNRHAAIITELQRATTPKLDAAAVVAELRRGMVRQQVARGYGTKN